MAVQAVPGFNLQPSASQVPLSTNYITNFDFLNQYLPDTYEKEFERYGNRTVASFLRLLTLTLSNGQNKVVYTLNMWIVQLQLLQVLQLQHLQ